MISTSDLPRDRQDPEATQVIGQGAVAAVARAAGTSSVALPTGTRLSDEFEIVGLVGQGGFGIVYLADDHSLQRRVAVKEYMPASLAMRGASSHVVLKSERDADTFGVGLRSFVNEARLLARFDHPALLKVFRFWEANGTAYMAMPYYAGRTLKQVIESSASPPDEAWMRRVLLPVMDALALLHSENCFHRDVAPDNIMLLEGDKPVLLDFGAARRVIGDMTQALTVILKPGYAPIEQYAEMSGVRQGAWTDVYALAAVVHWMITGHTPPPAVGRMMSDSYEPLVRLAGERYSQRFLQGIDRCLSVRGEDRPQSMAAMRDLLGWNPSPSTATEQARITADLSPGAADQNDPAPTSAVPAARQPLVAASVTDEVSIPPSVQPQQSGQRKLLLMGGALLLALAATAAWWFTSRPATGTAPTRQTAVNSTPSAAPAPAAVSEPVSTIPLSISTPKVDQRYTQGEAITIRVRPARQAWVYCFMQDARGQLMRFFPNRFQPSAALAVEGIELPGKLKFRINADFSGQPEWIACAASPVVLDQHPLLVSGDFVALTAVGPEDLRARLASLAGAEMGWARLELRKR